MCKNIVFAAWFHAKGAHKLQFTSHPDILGFHFVKHLIFHFVLYEYKTRCRRLREEYSLRTFEKGTLRGIFGPKRKEVAGEWRKLHNEKLT